MIQTGVVPTQVGIRQFRSGKCFSYFLFDRRSRKAIVVDPHLGLMEDYREFLVERDLRLISAIDTHLHDDHYSATHLLHAADKTVSIAMSHQTKSARVGKKLFPNDLIQVGDLEFKVLETPGHTLDSISLLGCGLIFTGDALWIGTAAVADPKLQQKTVSEVFDPLSDSTLVFPGHGEDDLTFSLLGVERAKNPDCGDSTRQQGQRTGFESALAQKYILFNQQLSPPDEVSFIPTAQDSSSNRPEEIRVGSIGIEKYKNKLEEKKGDSAFIDVREESEFRKGNIPGTRNIPLSELGLHWKELSSYKRIYVSCQAGPRSWRAARTLSYLGMMDVVNVSGGFSAWTQSGFSIRREMA